MPFKIVDADRRPAASVVWLARAFDVFEMSGAPTVLGALFVWWLAVLRAGVSALGVDLSHIGGKEEYGIQNGSTASKPTKEKVA